MAQIFPKWTNQIPKVGPVALVLLVGLIVFVFWYWFSPYNLDVGYSPEQPVHYSHKLHAGVLGMDCRYCHANVERSPHAGVPATKTCMTCHATVKADSFELAPVRDSWINDTSVPWVRIHKMPDYVYFDHSVHLAAGVGCVSCHGRVDQMIQVRQEMPLSMGWCLNCHRDPAPHLRPTDEITNMNFKPSGEWMQMAEAKAKTLHPPIESCSGCHR